MKDYILGRKTETTANFKLNNITSTEDMSSTELFSACFKVHINCSFYQDLLKCFLLS